MSTGERDFAGLPDRLVPQPPALPGLRLGPLLGAGGMGHVFQALDATGRAVAVKVLPRRSLQPAAEQRFQREAELLARVDAPGILRIHTWGVTTEVCYLVCELVRGEHLDVAARTLGCAARLDLIQQLVAAVAAAHRAGVIHRDLKPSNILVDDQGRVRVIDFGLSTAADQGRLTRTGALLGTPEYMPPEAVDGVVEDPRGDVWTLGAIAYEVLSGLHPYPLTRIEDLGRRADPPPRLEVPEAPPGLDRVLRRALDPDPARRFADAGALEDALRAPPRPDSGWAKTAAIAAALLLLGGLAASAYSNRRAPPPTPSPPPSPGAGASPGPAGAHGARARALLDAGRWRELRALFGAAAPADPALRRQLGHALLYTDGPAAAAALLPAEDPCLVVEQRGRALEALLAAERPEPRLAALRALSDAAETLGADPKPERTEARRRAQRRLLRGLTQANETLQLLQVTPAEVARLVAQARALDPSTPARTFELLELWLGFGQRCFPQPTLVALREFLTPRARALFGAHSDWSGLPPELEHLAAQLEVLLLAPERELTPALRRRAVAALRAPGSRFLARYLRQAVHRRLALQARNDACRALRRRDPAGRALADDGAHHAREGWKIRRQAYLLGLLLAQLELIGGKPTSARRTLGALPDSALRRHLLATCDLVEGRVGRLPAAEDRRRPLHGPTWRLRLHARVLRGELSPERALAQARRNGALREPKPHRPEWIEWYSERSFEDVLRGGWWPGSK